MRTVTLLALVPLLTGCPGMLRPTAPKVVTKTVEVYRPLPEWATRELPEATAPDSTVGGLLDGYHARGAVIELAACHRRLLALLDQGWPVPKDACQKPQP